MPYSVLATHDLGEIDQISFRVSYTTRPTRSRTSSCRCPSVALFGHGAMSDLSPLSGAKRTCRLSFGQVSELSVPLDRELLEEIVELEVGRLSTFEDGLDKGR
jgi:hypothetical protein